MYISRFLLHFVMLATLEFDLNSFKLILHIPQYCPVTAASHQVHHQHFHHV